MADELLPIKVVFPGKEDYRRQRRQSRPFAPLVEVTPELRQALTGQVETVKTALAPSFARWQAVPGVARVVLRENALVKSKRPDELFNGDTCPVIGVAGAGELLVSVDQRGLRLIEERLQKQDDLTVSHISTIERIEPFTAPVNTAPKPGDKHAQPTFLVTLAKHNSDKANQEIESRFIEVVKQHGATTIERMEYTPELCSYKVVGLRHDGIEELRRFAGLQSIDTFGTFIQTRTSATVVEEAKAEHFPPPDPDREYGIVGLIDSGTNPDDPMIQAWVHDRYEEFVPRGREDWTHGNFVAGVIANGRVLNDGDDRFPSFGAKIVDVVAVEKDGKLSEEELFYIIKKSIDKYPHVKVWNLSLSLIGDPCNDSEVYRFSALLDDLARKHQVLFVIAAGNYTTIPLTIRPPSSADVDDRIRPPADCVRGITVGGLAHVQPEGAVAPPEFPSPFSRRGPAAAGIIKPEIMHYAGNCSGNGDFPSCGIRSLDGMGNIAENIGVSFACPSVAAVAANVHRELSVIGNDADPTLVKAMMVHATFVKNGPASAHHVHYRGLGACADVSDILHCTQSSATVVLNTLVSSNPWFEKKPFPIPRCLMTDKGLDCEVFMTLHYDCDLDVRFGLECCRRQVTASLGSYQIDPQTGLEAKDSYVRQILPIPADIKGQFADDVHEAGFQWAPLKMYYRSFASTGPLDKPWRLTLKALDRGEYNNDEEQHAYVLVTIRARNKNLPVYDEMVQSMNGLGWETVDLPIRSRVRQQTR